MPKECKLKFSTLKRIYIPIKWDSYEFSQVITMEKMWKRFSISTKMWKTGKLLIKKFIFHKFIIIKTMINKGLFVVTHIIHSMWITIYI